ncbi:hypothetical protein DPMN_108572 [Dreissena polymorpha]|uniref:Uncharacterized protein n=1 Tax=Dreissena polymorpha TaxID=45954 RepID=A0A9D4K945_DREPO|nr:hypothetical protein DPMN_108572 [Dreissena polymorpha]
MPQSGLELPACRDGESTWKMLTLSCSHYQATKTPCFLEYLMVMGKAPVLKMGCTQAVPRLHTMPV